MQIIGSRPNSSFRVNDQYFVQRTWMTPGQDPTSGGPLKIVEDWTDDPPVARQGHHWVLDVDPNSNTYRQCVQVPLPQAQQQGI